MRNSDDLISVIVPVYNTECYIHNCINSILEQTHKNLEVILIDDGSTDGCPDICDQYEKLDNRIKVIHKKNGGLSDARNCGLNVCNGEWIAFVDSDDWVEMHMYEKMLEACINRDAKLAVCGRYDVFDRKQKLIGICPSADKLVKTEDLLSKIFLLQEADSSACDKLFHRSLWKNFRFEKGKINEDVRLMYKVVEQVENCAMIALPLYNYNHHTGSITTTFREDLLDYPIVTKDITQYIKTYYPQIYNSALYQHIKCTDYLIGVLCNMNFNEFKKYRKQYNMFVKDIVKSKKMWKSFDLFSKKDKLRYNVMCFGVYRFFYKLYKKLKGSE